ncbi:MAG: hypothetical protein CSA62_13205 [Planctomycetota bacterium]|nr:MAG: hypothetical protein CSA62_13205 [Planctomycetota bacterium]
MAHDVEIPGTGSERQLLRTLLSFVLPLLILGATWRILARFEPSPMELQLLVVDRSSQALPPWTGLGLDPFLNALGFFELSRGWQLGILLGVYAAGLVYLGFDALLRRKLSLAALAPSLALYSLLLWFLPVENGALGLSGLLFFPLACFLRRRMRGSWVLLLAFALALGLLPPLAAASLTPSLVLLMGGFFSPREEGDGLGLHWAWLLLALVLALGLGSFLSQQRLFRPVDVFAGLREGRHFAFWWLLLLASAVAVPGLFGFAERGRAPRFLRLGFLLLSFLFAVNARSSLTELNRAYEQDRQSLARAIQGLQPGFPWLVVNLPSYLRPHFASAVPPAQWPLVRSLYLFDTGEQIFLPEEFRFEGWLPTLRYTRRGFVVSSWEDLGLFGAPPSVWSMGKETAPESLRAMLQLGDLADASAKPEFKVLRVAPLRVPGRLSRQLQLDLDLTLSQPIRLGLLLPSEAASWREGFSGEWHAGGAAPSPFLPEVSEGFVAGDDPLKQGRLRLLAKARGFGLIVELVPENGHVRGQIVLPAH